MRFRVILSLLTMAMACFTLAVWTSPYSDDNRGSRPMEDERDRQFE
jgi:cbb3-type cytochrome oxidase subunit 3